MPRYILAVDPGKATGIALFSWIPGEDPILINSWEVTFATFATEIRGAIFAYPSVEIVCESYIITVQTAKYGSSPWSLEHIGALRQIMMDAGMDYENLPLQSSQSIKKSSFTNPALKKLGYWHRGGKGHALDAIRHGLLYITKEGWTASGILS